MKRILSLLKFVLPLLLSLLLVPAPASAGIKNLVKKVSNATGDMVDDVVDTAKDTYHGAKRTGRSIYRAGQHLGEYFIEAEVRGLTKIVKFGKNVVKTEAQLLEQIALTPAYVITDFVSAAGRSQMPVKRSDLTVSHLTLDEDGYVIVYVQNIGEGIITINPRSPVQTMDLYLKLNGKNWGGSTHKLFDPEKVLLFPGGRIRIQTGLQLAAPQTVTAIIDMNNAVIESNESNNTMTAQLDPRKPDLAVTAIALDGECKVNVTVRNLGPGPVSSMVWLHQRFKDTGLYLKVNGRNWGGATFRGLDPDRQLAQANGTVTYRSNLRISAQTSVTATIDDKSLIREGNEANNHMTQTLNCSQTSALKPVATGLAPIQARPARTIDQAAPTPSGERPQLTRITPRTGVQQAGLPDLQITRVRMTENPTVGKRTVFMASVHNAGTATAPPSQAMIRVGGETHGKVYDVPALEPGKSYRIRRTEQLSRPQQYRTTIVADIAHQVAESNESNNETVLNFNVQ